MDQVPVPDLCPCCAAHHGFWESWLGQRKPVLHILTRLHAQNPDYRIAIVGHSLGGAIATLAAGDIRTLGTWWSDNVELYTYGSPRVGNTATVRFLSQQSTNGNKSYRVTATHDPIPRVPFTSLGYQHTSPEYWIHSHRDDPGPEDVDVLWGYFNPNGVNQYGMLTDGVDMESHHHYFGDIVGCDPEPPGDPNVGDFGGRGGGGHVR